MKTLPTLALPSALLAFFLVPMTIEWAVSLLFVAGLVSLLVADYTRPVRVRRAPVRTVAATAYEQRRPAVLGLAA